MLSRCAMGANFSARSASSCPLAIRSLRTEQLLRDAAAHAGLIMRNVGLIEELRESRRRIVAAQDRAREGTREEHPRRRSATARRASAEAPGSGETRWPRSGEGGRDGRGATARRHRCPREPARPRPRHLPARCSRTRGSRQPSLPRSERRPCRWTSKPMASAATRKTWSQRCISPVSKRCRTSPNTPKQRGLTSDSPWKPASSFFRSLTMAQDSTPTRCGQVAALLG